MQKMTTAQLLIAAVKAEDAIKKARAAGASPEVIEALESTLRSAKAQAFADALSQRLFKFIA